MFLTITLAFFYYSGGLEEAAYQSRRNFMVISWGFTVGEN
jgi:hypothetical protein